MNIYRSELPPIPECMKSLPVERGYPVPWFAPFVDGHWEFRMGDAPKLTEAIKNKRCWICGQRLGKFFAFTIGPMCSINRISAEPPEHLECAEFSAIACPFLTGKEMERREGGLPKAEPEVGFMIRRNPGCCVVWETTRYELLKIPNGVLFRIGNPSSIKWFAKGRKATRAEVMESINSGYPILLEQALADGPDAVAELQRMRETAAKLIPA